MNNDLIKNHNKPHDNQRLKSQHHLMPFFSAPGGIGNALIFKAQLLIHLNLPFKAGKYKLSSLVISLSLGILSQVPDLCAPEAHPVPEA